jgi:hypothetical protein
VEISFTKRENNDHIISCKRNDGSVTWMHNSPFFITHDICHYALESTLHLKKAFCGLVAAGTDIKEFDLPRDKRAVQLTDEAIFAEQMVNLLTIEYSQGIIENFIVTIKDVCSKSGIKIMPEMNEDQLQETRNLYRQLMNKWNLLLQEETMNLIFEE